MDRGIHAVIFDQDGLMFDTERLSARVWGVVEKELNLGIHFDEAFLSTVRGMNPADASKRFKEKFGEDFDYDMVRSRKQEHFVKLLRAEGVPVKRGLKELLLYLKEHGFKIALATASSKEYTLANLRDAGIEEYFEHIVTGDMVNRSKPDPEVFCRAASMIGEAPENCLVLEDSLNGVEAGLNGGFHVIMVPDLTQPPQEFKSRLDSVCGSLLEVPQWLERAGKC